MNNYFVRDCFILVFLCCFMFINLKETLAQEPLEGFLPEYKKQWEELAVYSTEELLGFYENPLLMQEKRKKIQGENPSTIIKILKARGIDEVLESRLLDLYYRGKLDTDGGEFLKYLCKKVREKTSTVEEKGRFDKVLGSLSIFYLQGKVPDKILIDCLLLMGGGDDYLDYLRANKEGTNLERDKPYGLEKIVCILYPLLQNDSDFARINASAALKMLAVRDPNIVYDVIVNLNMAAQIEKYGKNYKRMNLKQKGKDSSTDKKLKIEKGNVKNMKRIAEGFLFDASELEDYMVRYLANGGEIADQKSWDEYISKKSKK